MGLILIITLILYIEFKPKYIRDYFDFEEINDCNIILRDGNNGNEYLINDKVLIKNTFVKLKFIKLSLMWKIPSGGYTYNFIVKKNGSIIFNMSILSHSTVKIKGSLYNTSESVLQIVTNLVSESDK